MRTYAPIYGYIPTYIPRDRHTDTKTDRDKDRHRDRDRDRDRDKHRDRDRHRDRDGEKDVRAVPSVRAVPPSPGQLKFEILRKNLKKTERNKNENRKRIFDRYHFGAVVTLNIRKHISCRERAA